MNVDSERYRRCMEFDGGLERLTSCQGYVDYYQREAKSFGVAFETHAWLCAGHAKRLGYRQALEPAAQ